VELTPGPRGAASWSVAVPHHIWQARFYDFNLWTERKRIEKLRYMHRNPVQRGLVESPEQWRWSSFRWYLCGEAGPVRINDTDILHMRVRARGGLRIAAEWWVPGPRKTGETRGTPAPPGLACGEDIFLARDPGHPRWEEQVKACRAMERT